MWNKYLLRIKSIHKNPSSYLFSLKSPCGFPIRCGCLYPFGSSGRRIGGMTGQKGAETAAFLSKHATSKIGCFRPFLPAAYSRLAAELRLWASNNAARTCGSIRPAEMIRNSSIFSQALGKRHAADAASSPAIPHAQAAKRFRRREEALPRIRQSLLIKQEAKGFFRLADAFLYITPGR